MAHILRFHLWGGKKKISYDNSWGLSKWVSTNHETILAKGRFPPNTKITLDTDSKMAMKFFSLLLENGGFGNTFLEKICRRRTCRMSFFLWLTFWDFIYGEVNRKAVIWITNKRSKIPLGGSKPSIACPEEEKKNFIPNSEPFLSLPILKSIYGDLFNECHSEL